jgi:hypothetical protein
MRSTGLGLAFCKMVVEAHNCIIGVDSEPGKSTTFWFTLSKGGTQTIVSEGNIKILTEKLKADLSVDDKDYLKNFVTDLSAFKFYHIGKTLPVLSSIDDTRSPAVKRWKTEIENAVYANNETQFKQLLSSVNDEKNPGS